MADHDENDDPLPLYDEDEPEGGMFRWMSGVVVLLAVAGFFGLAWYAYRNGGDTVDEKDVELIQAEKTPVKEAPANPGGMQIPNQDKTVYGLISGKNEKQPVVERILPAPEEPVVRTGDTETWMSDSVKNKSGTGVEAVRIDPATGAPTSTSAPTDTTVSKEQFNPAKAHATATAAPVQSVGSSTLMAATPANPTVAAPVATTTAAPAIAPAASPAPAPMVATPKPAAAPTVEKSSDDSDDADDEKPALKPEAKAGSTPPSGVRIQLGAYKSQGEADGNWKKIAKNFSDDLQGKQHYVVRADLGSKGTFYRLQVAPFASSKDAEQFCLDFVSSGQGCILAKGK